MVRSCGSCCWFSYRHCCNHPGHKDGEVTADCDDLEEYESDFGECDDIDDDYGDYDDFDEW